MIKSAKISGLKGPGTELNFEFDPQLNIFTGRNGARKTTVLKLLWYLMSQNMDGLDDEAVDEAVAWEIDVEYKGSSYKRQFNLDHQGTLITSSSPQKQEQKTIFFPTFRRIEGGFVLPGKAQHRELFSFSSVLDQMMYGQGSMAKHRFVAQVSMEDVEQLLIQRYATVSESLMQLEMAQSAFILDSINKRERFSSEEILQQIKIRQEETNRQREALLRPFDRLSELIQTLFQDKGVQITKKLSFGQAKTFIQSQALSAGEKQLLSFLCYAIFAEDSLIFIDEPELSLHPDWQRILIPMLLDIGPSNQYFIATHSPFIYANYPEYEFVLDTDKGGH